jgi:diaminohydroxyphosphoribosylaminopyrimidine deaminase/5-amino-6-(5-phosphoribosylamino)uracil reductase
VNAWSQRDQALMRRALSLAARGRGRVEPNPMVGCVIVRDGRIIGEGHHRRFGGPHAEIEALRRCGEAARGATIYVTLEPCCIQGKTPPCSEALIEARVGRVVAAMRDPNPLVHGRGARRLRAAGIACEFGLLEAEARELNAPFSKLMTRQRPWVILKWAQSIDGRIASRGGDAKWISDEAARAHAHRTRAAMDGIIVGVRTVLADDPRLTARTARPRRVAARLVLDTRLRTPAESRLVRTARETPTWLFCGDNAAPRKVRRFERLGCVVHPVPRDGDVVSLDAVLGALGAAKMTNILVEGGGRVLGSFLDRGLADEAHIYIAPLLIGGREAPAALDGEGSERIADALRLSPTPPLRRVGDGWFIRARLGR